MTAILFLCHGNICRSPMAEFVMKDKLDRAGLGEVVQVESAALHTDEIGSDIHRGTRKILEHYNIPFTPRAAHLVCREDYDRFDYIVGMDEYNRRDMMRLFRNDPEEKCSLLLDWVGLSRDVADPWYTGDFETTFDDVDAGCTVLLEHLKRSLRF